MNPKSQWSGEFCKRNFHGSYNLDSSLWPEKFCSMADDNTKMVGYWLYNDPVRDSRGIAVV